MASPMRRLILEIDPRSDPIAGRLGDERGTHPFTGWLELAAALHAALNAPPASEELNGEQAISPGFDQP